MTKKQRGKTAYEGYCYFSNYKSLVSGQQLPSWENLSDEIKSAWNVAAAEVEREIQYELKETIVSLISKHFSGVEII